MPDMIGNMQEQFKEFWQNMDSKQKTKLLSIVILSVLIVGIGIYLLSRPTYVTLFNKLEASDMVKATEKLGELSIPYKMSDDGYSLLVASNKKGLAQVQLSNAGIPKKSTSYADALSSSKSTLGQTESEKTRQYIEYKSSEIANVLVNNSDSISAAEVFLNIPQSDNFFGEDKKSTASVKITPNGELSSAQIDGIARFVANSVQGLDAKDVEVVDNNMRTLKDYEGSGIDIANTQYKMERQANKDKEKEITDLLATKTADYDDVKVVPNLKLDFNSQTSTANTLEPVTDGQGAIISQSQDVENLQNGTAQGGVPGTDSNSGTGTQTITTGNGGTYSKSNTVTNYEWNKTTTQQEKARGQIDKNNSTISVILRYGKTVQQAPSQAVIDTVINQVSGATGLSADKIMVNSQKMAADTTQKSGVDFVYLIQQYGAIAIAAILIGLLAFAVFTGPKKFKVPKLAEDPDFDVSMNSANYANFVNGFNNKNEKTLEEIELEEKSEVKKQIDKFVKQKPEAVASLLRNWLAEDWE